MLSNLHEEEEILDCQHAANIKLRCFSSFSLNSPVIVGTEIKEGIRKSLSGLNADR